VYNVSRRRDTRDQDVTIHYNGCLESSRPSAWNVRKPEETARGPRGVELASRFPSNLEGTVARIITDDWTIERWRTDPHPSSLQLVDDDAPGEQAPPLWKDLSVASAIAVLLWAAAAVVFR